MLVAAVAVEPHVELPLYNAIRPRRPLLPPPVPTVRKRDDAPFRLPGALAASLTTGGAWIISPSK
jgi:hypothetical protein